MTETELLTLFKCLADKSRLLILRSLAKEDMYVERLAERLALAPGTVSFHLKKLEEAGAVTARKEQYYTVYALCPDTFAFRVLDVLAHGDETGTAQDERDAMYRQRVLSSFFADGKLKKLPTQRKKKNIILEELCTRFAPDRAYSEKEVNLIIAEVYDDFCTARRDMIGAGLLRRENSIYYKCGQRVRG